MTTPSPDPPDPSPPAQVVQEPKQSYILWWVSLEVLGLIFLFALIPRFPLPIM